VLSTEVGTQGITFSVTVTSATNPALSVGAEASLLCNPSGCAETSGTGQLITSKAGVNDIEFLLNLTSLQASSLVLDESSIIALPRQAFSFDRDNPSSCWKL
jgi:hypothetical protein